MEISGSTILATLLISSFPVINPPTYVPDKEFGRGVQIIVDPYQSEYSEFTLSQNFLNQEEKSEIFIKFASHLLEGMKDNPPEYNKVIDEHFWELF